MIDVTISIWWAVVSFYLIFVNFVWIHDLYKRIKKRNTQLEFYQKEAGNIGVKDSFSNDVALIVVNDNGPVEELLVHYYIKGGMSVMRIPLELNGVVDFIRLNNLIEHHKLTKHEK